MPAMVAGRVCSHNFSLELLSVFGVGVPATLQTQVFTGGEFRQVAYNGDHTVPILTWQGMTAGYLFWLQAQDGITVFRVVKGDAFNGAGQVVHGGKYTWIVRRISMV